MEGKTTVVSNLGIALAEISGKVLLIDGDMRRPRLHKVFDQANSWGLSDVLPKRTPSRIFPSMRSSKRRRSPPLPAPQRNLDRQRLRPAVLRENGPAASAFCQEFDYVLVDAPPCLEFADEDHRPLRRKAAARRARQFHRQKDGAGRRTTAFAGWNSCDGSTSTIGTRRAAMGTATPATTVLTVRMPRERKRVLSLAAPAMCRSERSCRLPPCLKPAGILPKPEHGQRRKACLCDRFAWVLTGNIVYAACQWGMIVALAKLGNSVMVGQFSLGLAIATPVLVFTNLHLRAVQATDARRLYSFKEYLQLRMAMTLAAMVVIAGIVSVGHYERRTAMVVLAVASAKGIETLSDIHYGLFQLNDRLDQTSRSMMIRGILSVVVLSAGIYLTRSVFWGCAGLALVWLAALLLFDVRRGRRFVARSAPGFRLPWI